MTRTRTRSVETTPWRYGGRRVLLPFAADVPAEFRPDGPLAWVVQEVLDEVEPWKKGEQPIESGLFDRGFFELVVPVPAGARRLWGIHRGHHARDPQLSPFVELAGASPKTNWFTIHLEGTPGSPLVVRAYPGNEIPPLPWMKSAEVYDWPAQKIHEFWRTHAYVWRETLVARGTQSNRPPAWFTK